jgi:PIN domain nuclease of toxin-antitoxin system
MTYLLDTHYMIWAITDTSKITKSIKNVISDPDNRIIVSTISFWEVALKSSIGKLDISGFSPADLPSACLEMGFEIKPLSAEESSTYDQLTAAYHKDPFDRMLIWQAILNSYILISIDSNVKKYTTEGLRLLPQK